MCIVRAQSSCQFDLRQYLRPQCIAKKRCNPQLCVHCGALQNLEICCHYIWILCSLLWHCSNINRLATNPNCSEKQPLQQNLFHFNESKQFHCNSASSLSSSSTWSLIIAILLFSYLEIIRTALFMISTLIISFSMCIILIGAIYFTRQWDRLISLHRGPLVKGV